MIDHRLAFLVLTGMSCWKKVEVGLCSSRFCQQEVGVEDEKEFVQNCFEQMMRFKEFLQSCEEDRTKERSQ